MAEFTYNVVEGQNIFDVVSLQYGTLENLFDIFTLNSSLDINSVLASGDELIIDNEGRGDESVKNNFIRTSHVTNNAEVFIPAPLSGKLWQNGDNALFQNGETYNFN